ncbi:uncharacterized protein LOC125906366 [Epinephelus fuscoguttatus]|uniref:uncharacterized protein LOC125906366 n=1 Tax=Epinephelus fuscoguttatus TaxID=293821 RepID=UPI0020D063AD|nr:uncharacterized protein LOC125906366 [Epinephelus fuscoguttatus]
MGVAASRLKVVKIGCFAHSLNLAAQKLYTEPTVSKWAARIQAVVVWLRKASLAKPVMKEKQRLLNLPQHAMVLDMRTRWNTLYLMIEQFVEQYSAIQAASLDPRLRMSMERDRLERITDQDFRRAEEFVRVMRIFYTSTLYVSSERTPACGQILPILQKLEGHLKVQDADSTFTAAIKKRVWDDLSKRYTDENIRMFLEEATSLNPRLKTKILDAAVWSRLKEKACGENSEQHALEIDEDGEDQLDEGMEEEEEDEEAASMENTTHTAVTTSHSMSDSALGKLFAEEDLALKTNQAASLLDQSEKAWKELELYRVLPMLVYDRLTLLNIRDSLEKRPICGSDGHSKIPPPFLASIPPQLRRLSCWLSRNSRRRRRGKRGGVLIKLKSYLASSCHDPCRLLAGSSADYRGYDLRSSKEYRYRWLRPVFQDTGAPLPCCRLVRTSQRGCVPGNLRSLTRSSLQTGQCSVHTALINTRSLTNKTLILNDFFTTYDLDFLLLTETWLKPGENSAFSELLPPGCSFFSTPRAAGRGGGLAAIFKESFRCL